MIPVRHPNGTQANPSHPPARSLGRVVDQHIPGTTQSTLSLSTLCSRSRSLRRHATRNFPLKRLDSVSACSNIQGPTGMGLASSVALKPPVKIEDGRQRGVIATCNEPAGKRPDAAPKSPNELPLCRSIQRGTSFLCHLAIYFLSGNFAPRSRSSPSDEQRAHLRFPVSRMEAFILASEEAKLTTGVGSNMLRKYGTNREVLYPDSCGIRVRCAILNTHPSRPIPDLTTQNTANRQCMGIAWGQNPGNISRICGPPASDHPLHEDIRQDPATLCGALLSSKFGPMKTSPYF